MPSDLPSFSDPVALARQVGITASGVVHRNLSVEALYEIAVQTGQATVMSNGALRQLTAPFFGRAAQSSFYVNDPAIRVQGRSLDELIAWGDPEQGEWDNLPISSDVWNDLYARVVEHLNSAPRLCLCDGHSARTERTRLNVRVVTDRAVGALFSKNIFLRPSDEQLVGFVPGWTILHAPDVRADPDHGTHTSAFVITHIGLRTTIIGGTRYNGQIKKAIFAVQNLLLPLRGILTMHAGASEGQGGRAAIHAGLSGTGKTTLSNTGFPVADDQIIVDTDADEHEVITNMEGGQYAKTENLRRDKEPEVYDAILYGATAENIVVGDNGEPDYADASITPNGRVGYPLEFVKTAKKSGACRAPDCITFLTADGFGVLPPLAKLTPEGAMYHFAMGFTSKMPGTERGVNEPKPTFSAFFGKPFMPLKPEYYTNLLRELIDRCDTSVWLVNTGWLGPNHPGRGRVDILVSKAIINAVRDGKIDLSDDNFVYDERFKLMVPKSVPGVDDAMLDPRAAWADQEAYNASAEKLAGIFARHAASVPDLPQNVLDAGPKPLG